MHTYIDSATQPAVTGEGTLINPAHLQGYEANNTFTAAAAGAAMLILSQAQFPIENSARAQLAQIRPMSTGSTEHGDN